MKELKVEHLNKSVGDKVLFTDASFLLRENDRVGLIGDNGTGKTSLLNLIFDGYGFDGDVNPIQKPADFTITYLSQTPDFKEEDSVLEAVLTSNQPAIRAVFNYEQALLALSREHTPKFQRQLELAEERMHETNAWTIEAEVKAILTQLEITDFHQRIGELSGGQKRRVQLANALVTPTDLLLLDEPTNHLDARAILWLQSYLMKFKGILLFVTHDRYFLDAVSNKIFEITNQAIQQYQGNYADYLAQRAQREQLLVSQTHKAKQLYKDELAWMRAGAKARSTKQQARINRFNALEETLKGQKVKTKLDIHFDASRIGKKVIEIIDASFRYDQQIIFEDFNLIIQNTDRIGVLGKNGAGKTTLLKLLTGELSLTSGSFAAGKTLRIGYFSQEIKNLDDTKRVLPFLQSFAESYQSAGETISITSLLEQFLFPKESHGKLIGTLSGGERKRLYLLTLLIKKPNFLIMDEPTNDLDVATLIVLEHFLRKFQGPIVVVSHDRYFMDKVTDKLLVIKDKRITEYFGNYSDFLNEQADKQATSNISAKPAGAGQQKPVSQKLSYFEKKEWLVIEDEIAELEVQLETIDTQMNDCGSDFSQLNQLQKELDELTARLEKKYERWEYLSEKASEADLRA